MRTGPNNEVSFDSHRKLVRWSCRDTAPDSLRRPRRERRKANEVGKHLRAARREPLGTEDIFLRDRHTPKRGRASAARACGALSCFRRFLVTATNVVTRVERVDALQVGRSLRRAHCARDASERALRGVEHYREGSCRSRLSPSPISYPFSSSEGHSMPWVRDTDRFRREGDRRKARAGRLRSPCLAQRRVTSWRGHRLDAAQVTACISRSSRGYWRAAPALRRFLLVDAMRARRRRA